MTSTRRSENGTLRSTVALPEDDVVFRLSQLLLLLREMDEQGRSNVTIERLSYYDFFVANPLLVVTDESDSDRISLVMAGFDSRALHYASPSHRFTTRRERLQHDLSLLISYGLMVPEVDRAILYKITPAGIRLADQFTAIYARAYKTSARIILRRLHKLSDKGLREQAQAWTTFKNFPGSESGNALFDLELLHTDFTHDHEHTGWPPE